MAGTRQISRSVLSEAIVTVDSGNTIILDEIVRLDKTLDALPEKRLTIAMQHHLDYIATNLEARLFTLRRTRGTIQRLLKRNEERIQTNERKKR